MTCCYDLGLHVAERMLDVDRCLDRVLGLRFVVVETWLAVPTVDSVERQEVDGFR